MAQSPQPKAFINFELSISIRLHGIYLFDLHQLITLRDIKTQPKSEHFRSVSAGAKSGLACQRQQREAFVPSLVPSHQLTPNFNSLIASKSYTPASTPHQTGALILDPSVL